MGSLVRPSADLFFHRYLGSMPMVNIQNCQSGGSHDAILLRTFRWLPVSMPPPILNHSPVGILRNAKGEKGSAARPPCASQPRARAPTSGILARIKKSATSGVAIQKRRKQRAKGKPNIWGAVVSNIGAVGPCPEPKKACSVACRTVGACLERLID